MGKRPLLLLPLVQSSVPLLQRPVRREALLLQIPVERKSLHLHPLLQRRAYLSVQRRALLGKLLAKIGTPTELLPPQKKALLLQKLLQTNIMVPLQIIGHRQRKDISSSIVPTDAD